jgi:nicotinate-nucleotide adenylyltransferase
VQIGLFFGTFNPIHVGHLIIANFMVELTEMDEVWFMVSPQNPFKVKASLQNEYDRLHLVELAIEGNRQLRANNFEFNLPRPSYTIDTLERLKEKYTNHNFSLIMGGDNLKSLPRWKNADRIVNDYKIFVYNRAGATGAELEHHPQVTVLDLPLLNISASFVRKCIKEGVSVKYLLPDKVHEYILDMNLYR